MTIAFIRKRIETGIYRADRVVPPAALPKDHIQDENQTVVWNRQFVENHNSKRMDIIQRNKSMQERIDRMFADDLQSALVHEYDMNETQAKLTFAKAWEDGHAEGYLEVTYHAVELAEFWTRLKNAK